MLDLAEIDRDLDAVVVDAAHLSEVRGARRARLALGDVDHELAALSNGAHIEPRPMREAPPVAAPIVAEAAPAAPPPAPAVEPLALDLDPGEAGFDDVDDLPREPTSASAAMPVELIEPPPARPPSVAPAALSVDDPNMDLASLLGESDPMRADEGAAPLSMAEMEPEPTAMFTAEDAARYSRPAPPLDETLAGMLEGTEEESVELDLDADMIEIDDEEAAQSAAAPKTAPPPPPKTAPPPPPSGSRPPAPGFLGKILQRKS
jgi:hypothetical protein